MAFYEEPEGYEKTAFSDPQGAWENLRSAVAENHWFPESNGLLFHVDEGMSWENVEIWAWFKKRAFRVTQAQGYPVAFDQAGG